MFAFFFALWLLLLLFCSTEKPVNIMNFKLHTHPPICFVGAFINYFSVNLPLIFFRWFDFFPLFFLMSPCASFVNQNHCAYIFLMFSQLTVEHTPCSHRAKHIGLMQVISLIHRALLPIRYLVVFFFSSFFTSSNMMEHGHTVICEAFSIK